MTDSILNDGVTGFDRGVGGGGGKGGCVVTAYLGKIDALVPFELRHQEVDHAVVEILAAQEGVPVRGFHLKYA